MNRHWFVQGSMPPEPGKPHWRKNIEAHVVTDSAAKAIALVVEKYPDIDVWTVTHRGAIEIIDGRGGA